MISDETAAFLQGAFLCVLLCVLLWVVLLALASRGHGSSSRDDQEESRGSSPEDRSRQLLAEMMGAADRATAMRARLLTPRESRQLAQGWLAVPSPSAKGWMYWVPQNGTDMVMLYKGDFRVADLCIQPKDSIPPGERVLVHKLMIEGDEERYLQTAKWHNVRCGWEYWECLLWRGAPVRRTRWTLWCWGLPQR